MTKTGKRLVAVALAGAFSVGFAAPAFAEGVPPPPQKCNSGGGNGSEPLLNDCDPGNSGGHNNGKD